MTMAALIAADRGLTPWSANSLYPSVQKQNPLPPLGVARKLPFETSNHELISAASLGAQPMEKPNSARGASGALPQLHTARGPGAPWTAPGAVAAQDLPAAVPYPRSDIVAGSGFNSARLALKKPKTPRELPQGVAATPEEAKEAYNTIDPEVAVRLDATVREFINRYEPGMRPDEATGVYVVLERCHSCDVHHRLTTRHQEYQYASLAKDLLQQVRSSTKGTILDVSEMLCELNSQPRRLGNSFAHGQEIWHHASRVGAFEVYLLTPNLGVEQQGTVAQFPGSRADPEGNHRSQPRHQHSLLQGRRQQEQARPTQPFDKTWGAKKVVKNTGYTATLIYSKLSSKSFPVPNQILRRLFTSMPRGVVTVHVFCPSGTPLKNFTVEAIETAPKPHDSEVTQDDLAIPGIPRGNDDDLVHMVVQGSDGCCQIEGVPLQTTLELRAYHVTMRMQTVEFVVSRLRVGFAFGADIVFRLWAIDVPGGLALVASGPETHPSMIHEKARPYEGRIDMHDGEPITTKGRVQLPWTSFRPEVVDSPNAFVALKTFHASGYYPGNRSVELENYTLRQLYQQEFCEIASLAAPTVCFQVVLPACHLPITGVRLEVVAEHQSTTSDEKGNARIILRQGSHTVRMMHPNLTLGWVEQRVIVSSMEPQMRLHLPPRLRVWRVPTVICGDVLGCKLWLAPVSQHQPDTNWEPFTGQLRAAGGVQIDVQDGVFNACDGLVEVLDDRTSLRPPSPDPIAGLEPIPPFARLVDSDSNDRGWEGLLSCSGCTEETALLIQPHWGPLHLGLALQAPSPPLPGVFEPVVVRALTSCCGTGVPGVAVECDGCKRSTTADDGLCVPQLSPEISCVDLSVMHGALGPLPLHYAMHLAAPDATGVGLPPAELPLVFEPCIYLFLVEAAHGSRQVKASASASDIPETALPYVGRVLLASGQEIARLSGLGKRSRVQEIYLHKIEEACPTNGLMCVPEIMGYQWLPSRPSPFANQAGCGIRKMLVDGPQMLGILRPFTTAVLFHGQELTIPTEECPLVGDVANYVMAILQKERGAEDASDVDETDEVASPSADRVFLTLEGPEPKKPLSSDQRLVPAQRLQLLARLEVRVVLGNSKVGIPGASVVVEGMPWLDPQKTNVNGNCELLIPIGPDRVQVSHAFLGGTQSFEVDLDRLRTVKTIKARACVSVFLQPQPESQSPDTPIQVWLCAQSAHLPDNARAVSGIVQIRSTDGDITTVAMDGKTVAEIDLDTGQVPLSSTSRKPHGPVAGLAFECKWGDCLWYPFENSWFLEDVKSWRALLARPLCIGELRPSIKVRCHGFGTEVESPVSREIRLPTQKSCSVKDLCEALSPNLDIPVNELAMFHNNFRLGRHDVVSTWATVDVWPSAPLQISVKTRCCCRGVPGVRLHINEDYGVSGGLSSAAFADIWKPGVMVRVRDGGIGSPAPNSEGMVVRMDQESRLCEVQFPASPAASSVQDPATRREVYPCESLDVSDKYRAGVTNGSGECSIVTTAGGEHIVYFTHSSFIDCFGMCKPGDNYVSRRLSVKRSVGVIESLSVDYALFVYMLNSLANGDMNSTVWLCTRSHTIPQNAQSINGEIVFDTSAGLARLPIGSPRSPLRVPDRCSVSVGQRCPLESLRLNIHTENGMLWCPEPVLADGKVDCLMCLLGEPIQIGTLKPAITVMCHNLGHEVPAELKLPMDTFGEVHLIRQHLADRLSVPVLDVGLHYLTGALVEDDLVLKSDHKFVAVLLGQLVVQVLVPEGVTPGASCKSYGLKGASLTINGEISGTTDESGTCTLRLTVGEHQLKLMHSCFGPAGREVRDVIVKHGAQNHRIVFADVRVYVFASRSDDDVDEVSDSLLVWICGDPDHIQGDVLPIEGRVWAKGLNGHEVSKTFQPNVTELVLLHGAEAETEGRLSSTDVGDVTEHPTVHCTLTSLDVEARKDGHCWRSRIPAPLVERAMEIGGCEYLRLLACPTVIGYLDPAFRVVLSPSLAPSLVGRSELWLPVLGYPTAADAATQVAKELGFSIDEEVVLLSSNGGIDLDDLTQATALPSDARLEAGSTVIAAETARVQLRIISGCCHAPVDGAAVAVDGVSKGITGTSGGIDSFVLTVGTHKVELEHVAFGRAGRVSQEIQVKRSELNELTFVADPRLHFYATEPEAEEEYDDADAGDEPDPYGIAYEPSCVWLAADPAHIPDDALPLQGNVVCNNASQDITRVVLNEDKLEPIVLRLGQAADATQQLCLLSTIRLSCSRKGFFWAPKDPSPLVERAAEIGGCELLRVIACPVSLGFLKPAVCVQCSSGERVIAPLDTFNEAPLLKGHLAAKMNMDEGEEKLILMSSIDGTRVKDDACIKPGASLVCLHTEDDFASTQELLQRAEAEEAETARASKEAVRIRKEAELNADDELLLIRH